MSPTNTFILNTICAGAFSVFLLLGIHFLCFKRARISRQNYRVLSGILLITMSLYTLFIDYETQFTTIEAASTVRLIIVLVSFVAVLCTVTYALYTNKGVKDEEEVEENQQKLAINEKPQANVAQSASKISEKTEDDVNTQLTEQSTELAAEQTAEQPLNQSTVQTEKEPSGQVAEQPLEQSTELSTEQTTEQVAEQSTEQLEAESQNAKSISEAQEDADAAQQMTAEDSTDEEEPKEAAPMENASIDDLIFFQKVEALMATKRLFCEQDISREQIAFAIGTNRTYLARSIKNATGKTFLEYITDLRTSYAATLLTTTNEPLDVIGTIAGFGSKSAYYRAFSAAYGCSPSEYRKR